MSLAVRSEELSGDAPAFDRVAAILDDVVTQLRAPAMSDDVLAGPELRPADAAFGDLWQRCSGDLTALAESVRRLSATVRAAAELYQQTDDMVASATRGDDGGL